MESAFGNGIWLVICWGCAALFLGIGLYASQLKKPMHFWSGQVIKSETVTDISAYNRANSRMWITYSLPYWAGGLLGMCNSWLGSAVLLLACFPGLAWLILHYRKIEKRYLIKYQNNPSDKNPL